MIILFSKINYLLIIMKLIFWIYLQFLKKLAVLEIYVFFIILFKSHLIIILGLFNSIFLKYLTSLAYFYKQNILNLVSS